MLSDKDKVLTPCINHLEVRVLPLNIDVFVNDTVSIGHRLVSGIEKTERGIGYILTIRSNESLQPEPAVISNLTRYDVSTEFDKLLKTIEGF